MCICQLRLKKNYRNNIFARYPNYLGAYTTPKLEFPFSRTSCVGTGHALEARVYAENPLKGFLPATGVLRRLREPASPASGGGGGSGGPDGISDPRASGSTGGVTVRVDTGVRQGDEVRRPSRQTSGSESL
jgi:acetyl/propionyl-CoA carboxylase alpha subunit